MQTVFGLGSHVEQGFRCTLEDRVVSWHDTELGCLVVGIADGHGGDAVAQWLGDNIGRAFCSDLKRSDPQNEQAVRECIKSCILRTDRAMFAVWERSEHGRDKSGSTLTGIAWWYKRFPLSMTCFNVGDSETLVWVRNREQQTSETVFSSLIRGPADDAEAQRIARAGRRVVHGFGAPRVDGILALSRALGDFELKTDKTTGTYLAELGAVSPEPDVTTIALERGRTFVIACCSDGIRDSRPLATQTVQELATRRGACQERARSIVSAALDQGSRDNVSCAVVQVHVT